VLTWGMCVLRVWGDVVKQEVEGCGRALSAASSSSKQVLCMNRMKLRSALLAVCPTQLMLWQGGTPIASLPVGVWPMLHMLAATPEVVFTYRITPHYGQVLNRALSSNHPSIHTPFTPPPHTHRGAGGGGG
jgi:hypothetical protein